MADDVLVRFGADMKDLLATVKQGQDGVLGFVDKVKAGFVSLAGVLAGGAMFKEVVDSAVKFSDELKDMTDLLGGTRDQAAALSQALNEIGSNSETYTFLITRLTRNLQENERTFNHYKVAIRDANGQLLSGRDILRNVLDRLLDFKEGTDRNTVASEMLGRGWSAALPLLKLTDERLADAAKTVDQLNLKLDPTIVFNYRESMANAKDVFQSMGLVIARDLLPRLTELARWFRSVGPEALEGTKVAMVAVYAAIQGLMVSVGTLIDLIKTAFQQLWALLTLPMRAGELRAQGEGFINSWRMAFNEVLAMGEGFVTRTQDRVKGAAKSLQEFTESLWPRGVRSPTSEELAAKGKGTPGGGGGGLAAPPSLTQMDQLRGFQEKVIQSEMDTSKKLLDIDRINLKAREELRDISKAQALVIEESYAERELDIKKEQFRKLIELEKANPSSNPHKIKELQLQIEAAEREHQVKLTEIRKNAALESAKYTIQAQQAMQGAFAGWLFDLMDKVQSMKDIIRGLGIEILRVFQRIIAAKLAENIFGPGTGGGKIVDMIVGPITTAINQMLGAWLVGEATMTAASTAETTTRTALTEAALITTVASSQAAAMAEVMSWAAAGAAAAMASVAAIPFVGWAMAPAVGLEHYMVAMSYLASVFAAEEGFDVPGNINPVTQLHAKEMVLPAELAEGVRAIIEKGGAREAGGVTFVGDIVDRDSVERFMRRQARPLGNALESAARNFMHLGKKR